MRRSVSLVAVLLICLADAAMAMTPRDETRVLEREAASYFVERAAYRNDATIAELLAESRLQLVEGTSGIWLQHSKDGGPSILALGVEPMDDDAAARTLLLIVSANGSDYPILTDAPLGSSAVRLQLLGTNDAVRVTTQSVDGFQIERVPAFDPLAKRETANSLRALRSEGLGETLSCLVSLFFANASWTNLVCAVTDYTICVAGSAGAGLVSCAVAFKQLLPDCSSDLPGLASCFGIATDTSDPAITISQPTNNATVNGTKSVTASVSDNALKAVSIQVEYQASSGRKVAAIADNQSLGGCSLNSTSATCSTQFNFGQAVNGSSATVRVTASDTAGNVATRTHNVTVSSAPTTYSIAGNAGQSGVGISGCNQSTQTDSNGNYQLNGCPAGTWTVTPSKSGCSFTPANRSVTVGPSTTGKDFMPSCGGGGTTTLNNGQTVGALTGAAGSWRYFKIAVPSGQSQLKITMSGGTGDADMHVRRNAAPTASLWDYRPYLSGNNETVTVSNPASGDWYIGLHAYSAYSGVSLNATYSGGSATCTPYSGSLSGTGSVAYAPSSAGYTVSGSGQHTGVLSGTGNDFDLYLQKFLNSTWTSVAMSTASGSSETVNYSGTSGTYRWRIHSYSGSGNYTVCTKKP